MTQVRHSCARHDLTTASLQKIDLAGDVGEYRGRAVLQLEVTHARAVLGSREVRAVAVLSDEQAGVQPS